MDENSFTPRAHGVVDCGADQAGVLCRIAHARVNTVNARSVRSFPSILRFQALGYIEGYSGHSAVSGLRVVSGHDLLKGEGMVDAARSGARFGEVDAFLEDASNDRVRRDSCGSLVARRRIAELLNEESRNIRVCGAERQPSARRPKRDISAKCASVGYDFRFVFPGHGATDTTAQKNKEDNSMTCSEKPLPCEGRVQPGTTWKVTSGAERAGAFDGPLFRLCSRSPVQSHQRALPMCSLTQAPRHG